MTTGVPTGVGPGYRSVVAPDPRNPLELFLRRLATHSELSDPEKTAILSLHYEREEKSAHRDIVHPGEVVTKACYVVEGLVGRFDQMRDGRRQITALHLPGDMCDLHSVVLPKASWSLTAVSKVTILRIPHGDLRAATKAFPNLGMVFWRDTAVDAAIIAKWFANLGRKDSVSRLAHLFCEIGLRMEVAGQGTRQRYPLRITQQDLADVAGITAVHLNRTLQALREAGAIEVRDGQVSIPDWELLVRTGEFDASYLRQSPPEAG